MCLSSTQRWVSNNVAAHLSQLCCLCLVHVCSVNISASLWRQRISFPFSFVTFTVFFLWLFDPFFSASLGVVAFLMHWKGGTEEMVEKRKKRAHLIWFGQHFFKIDLVSHWFHHLEKLNKSGYNLNWRLMHIRHWICNNLVQCSAWVCSNYV